ncbi:hypothetical protein SAMN05444161_7484 [Rhizobiales bacterium GAS191]|jgi:hypothetical protein|nr:hypothetical protein SAMN05519103_06829 [Rhizobiales bacterium GAS113]SED62807.1 hypothetical protein SAMN05519104_3959 [Rhizobiales bacterium GAS188]SEE85898.1 hypothetical protein SAMN05444161_7484 [Rhizobiales bacterium GAS191]
MEEIASAIGQTACMAMGSIVEHCQTDGAVPLLGYFIAGLMLVLGAICSTAVLKS